MSSLKVMKQSKKQSEKKSLVKDLISLRPITSVVITEKRPLQTLYNDSNPPPRSVDQFAPYLSKKLSLKRQEKIERIKGSPVKDSPTFALTSQKTTRCTTPKIKRPDLESLPDIEDDDERINSRINNEPLNRHVKMEKTFDKIASGAQTQALHKLIESTLQLYYLADNVFYYHDVSSIKVLYCPTTTCTCPHMIGIAGYTQFSRNIQNLDIACEHESYSKMYESSMIPPESHVLSFPLFDLSNNVKGIVEVVRNKGSPAFTKQDEEFAEYFQKKCKLYARWLFQPVLEDSFASDLIQTCGL